MGTIEERNNDNTTYIVGNSQSRQEYLEACRNPTSQNSQGRQGKSYIRRHRDGSTSCTRAFMNNQQEEKDRDDHPSYGSYNGEHSFLERRQFADQNLLLDLQTDSKEENDHQHIIHKLEQGHGLSMMRKDLMTSDRKIDRVL